MTQREYDMSIHSNPDARAWAKFFIKTQAETGFTIDEDLMITWFANAMMAMHDHDVQQAAIAQKDVQKVDTLLESLIDLATPDGGDVSDIGIQEAQQEPVPPFGSIRAAAMAIYKAPFRYEHGYVFDSANHMVADDGCIGDSDPSVKQAIASRIRGWGRIGYMPDAAKLQDEVGAMVADALSAYYTSPPDHREAMRLALDKLWTLVEHNRLHFGDTHNTVAVGNAAIAALEKELKWN